jgi:hypothetical protein
MAWHASMTMPTTDVCTGRQWLPLAAVPFSKFGVCPAAVNAKDACHFEWVLPVVPMQSTPASGAATAVCPNSVHARQSVQHTRCKDEGHVGQQSHQQASQGCSNAGRCDQGLGGISLHSTAQHSTACRSVARSHTHTSHLARQTWAQAVHNLKPQILLLQALTCQVSIWFCSTLVRQRASDPDAHPDPGQLTTHAA